MNKTEIYFFAGYDPVCPVPKAVASVGLAHRLAVVQETHRPDSVDMFFDQALWLSLLEFASNFRTDARVGIVDRQWPIHVEREEPKTTDEMPIEAYLSAWREDTDPEPAEYIMVRDGEELILCIATEFWTQVGGPMPYADSYTYSIFSKEELGDRVTQFMADTDASRGWQMSNEVRQVPRTNRKR